MPIPSRTTLLLFAFWSSTCHAVTSLCSPNEVVIFSCRANTKTISICASHDLSSSSGYMQYRLGSKSNVELVFPERKVHPRGHFTDSSVIYSRGSASYLSFVNGSFKYLLYDVLVGKSPPKIGHYHGVGVAVLRRELTVPLEVAEWPEEDFVSIIKCKPETISRQWNLIPKNILDQEEFYYFPTKVNDAIFEGKKWK